MPRLLPHIKHMGSWKSSISKIGRISEPSLKVNPAQPLSEGPEGAHDSSLGQSGTLGARRPRYDATNMPAAISEAAR